MDLITAVGVAIFVAGYVLITLEHKLGTHKSAISLALAGILWIMVALSGISHEIIEHTIEEAGHSIFGLVAFLLSAMALVEILIHYRLFDVVRYKLLKLHLTDKKQFLVMGFLTFFLSAVLDNLTITIIMIQIARRFFKGENLLVAAAGIVIMANAGGAWSPIGDVTTIMLWLAGKFSASEIIQNGFIPSLALGVVASLLLVRKIENMKGEDIDADRVTPTMSEKIVVGGALASFLLPLYMNTIHLPPYIGLIMGLGIVWTLIEFFKNQTQNPTHLDARIDAILQKTDIASLKFFIGILLAVAALEALGVLRLLSDSVFGQNPPFARVVAGNVAMGLLSAIVDNVPLTALSINILNVKDPNLWVLTALAVGTGGSCLVIGSVSGVVAMGMVKGLTFDKYLKVAFLPAFLGYLAAISIWFVQYQLIH